MVFKAMNAAQLTVFMQGALEHLASNREVLNSLNVFPVPDGDTGINMNLTISSAVKNISADNAGHIGKTCGDFSMGALMGARGNSGVILSQIFRGFAQSLAKNQKEVTTKQFVTALQKGVDLSYKSVMKPVEGTILTVFKDFTAGAKVYLDGGGEDMAEMLQAALSAGEKSLANTPNLLPVLKQAGVVDAGGKGILIIMEGGYLAVTGQKAVADTDFTKNTGVDSKTMTIVSENIEFGFCTELIIRGKHLPVDLIRNYYSKNIKGDCLLVVGTDELVKVHFHSNEPWKILQYAAKQGMICDIKIDNMRFQHSQLVFDANQTDKLAEVDEMDINKTANSPEQNCGVLAVCSGDGLSTIFEKMGAAVLRGGQTMNPSSEELLNAIAKINAKEIIVLPNNSNIVLAAQQAAKLTEKKIVIVPSKFVTQGIGAMLTFDVEAGAETNAEAMNEAIAEIKSGELTYAVRESNFNSFDIEAGDILAVYEGGIVGIGKEIYSTLEHLLDKMVEDFNEPNIITLFYGENINNEQAEEIKAKLLEKYADLDVEMYEGGQPLYYFLVSVE